MLFLKLSAPILMFAIAAIQIALDYIWHDKRTIAHRRLRRALPYLVGIGAVITILIVLGDHRQDQQARVQLLKLQTSLDDQRREATQRETHMNQVADERHGQLRQQYDSLNDMVAPVLQMARANAPQVEDREALNLLVQEMNAVINPRLVFLSERTAQTRIEDTGQYRTVYYFRSKYPVVLRDARVDLEFDVEVLDCTGKYLHTLPFNPNGNLTYYKDRKNALTMTAYHLGEAGQMEITVVTSAPPQIMKCTMLP